jgi:cardiolipin synthase
MHSKVAVIDTFWTTIGSSNIDPFSLLLAREANIIIQDKAFATELRTDIEFLIQDGGVKITPQEWVKASMIKRVASWVAYGAVRLFLGVIGHKHEH